MRLPEELPYNFALEADAVKQASFPGDFAPREAQRGVRCDWISTKDENI